MAPQNKAYDVVIVSGVTAGLVVASRLSDNREIQIPEAGQDQIRDPRAVTPALGAALYKTPSD